MKTPDIKSPFNKHLFFILFFVFVIQNVNAQTPNWQWAKKGDCANFAKVRATAIDANGNTYITGTFFNESIKFENIILYNSHLNDIFIVKYDGTGNLVWAKSVGSHRGEVVNDIAVDNNGSIYITGCYSSDYVWFDDIELVSHTNLKGYTDMFTAKYDANGNVLWAKQIGGNLNQVGSDIEVDGNGNVLVTGSSTMERHPLPYHHNNTYDDDILLIKYDPAGTVLWWKYEGGSSADGDRNDRDDDVKSCIAVDPVGNTYLAAEFASPSVIFGPSFSVNPGMALAKYDPTGTILWANSTISGAELSDIQVAHDGSIYVTGFLKDSSVLFGAVNLINSSGQDVFIVKYDNNGTMLWVKQSTSPSPTPTNPYGYDLLSSLAFDACGNPYITGNFFSSSIQFGTTTLTNTNTSNCDVFIAKYTTSGNVLWAKSVGTIANDFVEDIAVNASGNAYIVGGFEAPSMSFGTSTLTNSSTHCIFIAKLASSNLLPSQPGNILGNPSVQVGSRNTYSIAPVNNVNSYTWTLPNGWSGTSNSASINTTVGSVGGTITVKANNTCGSSLPRSFPVGIVAGTALLNTGPISGNATVCQGGSTTYSIPAVSGASSYTWTLPNGWSGTSTTNTITTVAGFGGGTISVVANNNFGSSVAQTLVVTSTIAPQTGNWKWAKNAVNTTSDNKAEAIAIDKWGNKYVVGTFSEPSIDFGGGHTLTNFGGEDMFIVKYNDNGDVLWAKRAWASSGLSPHPVGPSRVKPIAIAVDDDGNVYVTGWRWSVYLYFYETAYIFGSYSTNQMGQMTDPQTPEVFTIKYSPNGLLEWAKNEGTKAEDYIDNMAVDASGNVFISGHRTIDRGNGSITEPWLYDDENYIIKYDTDGNKLWTKDEKGSLSSNGHGCIVASDRNGNLYSARSLRRSNSSVESSLILGNYAFKDAHIIIAKHNLDGNVVWAKAAKGFGFVSDIATDGSNIYLTGCFTDSSIKFGSITLTNTDSLLPNTFIVKYDINGNVLWAKKIDDTNSHFSYYFNRRSICIDGSGNIYLTSIFDKSSIQMGTTTLTNKGGDDFFITKYSSNGDVIWTKSVGTTDREAVNDVAIDNNGDPYIVGAFYGPSVSFDSTTLTNSGTSSMFIAKLANSSAIPAKPVAIIGNAIACSGATQTYSVAPVSGATSYTWSLPNGWTGTSTNNSINVTASATGGTIAVIANNSCFSSGAQQLVVSVANGAPAQPASITGNTTVCVGSSNTYSVASVSGATSYIWTLPNGWTGASTTNSINVIAGTTNGTISVTAKNSCGVSIARTIAVSIRGLRYAAIPYTQSFETSWINGCDNKSIPATEWTNTPLTGNNSWRKENEGSTAFWTSPTTGSYSPAASVGTSSARFHSCRATAQTYGMFDLHLNLSTITTAAQLSFDHINKTGTDSLFVLLSTDGGLTFPTVVAKLGLASNWTLRTYNLGRVTSATTVIRFMAKSDRGRTDIGLDNVKVVNRVNALRSSDEGGEEETSSNNSDELPSTRNNIEDNSLVTVYPNPTNGLFTISVEQIPSKGEITIYNLLGELVYSKQVVSNKIEIDLSNQPKGVYVYKVQSENRSFKIGRVVLE